MKERPITLLNTMETPPVTTEPPLDAHQLEIQRLKQEIKTAYFEGFTWAGTAQAANKFWKESRAKRVAEGEE